MLGGFNGNGGAFLLLLRFLLTSSDDVSKSGCCPLPPMLLMTSLSLLIEFDALLFLRGGRLGGGIAGKLALLLVLPLRLPRKEDFEEIIAFVAAELLAMLTQPIPFRFFGFLVR